MLSATISFTKQPGKEGFLPITLTASNGEFAGTAQAQVYLDEFNYFVERLKTFPREPGDQVVFSCGGDDDAWPSYLYLGVYQLETSGQFALQVRLRRSEPEVQAGGAVFSIPANVSVINGLGRALETWLKSAEEKMDYAFE